MHFTLLKAVILLFIYLSADNSIGQSTKYAPDSGRSVLIEKNKHIRIDSIVPKLVNKEKIGLYICFFHDENNRFDNLRYVLLPNEIVFVKVNNRRYLKECKKMQDLLAKYLTGKQLSEICKYCRRFIGSW